MPKATPKSMKNRVRFADKEVCQLIIRAIICGRERNGATIKYIRNYVNANTNQPFISQKTINNNINSIIKKGKIVKSGAYYKLNQKKIKTVTTQKQLIRKKYSGNSISLQNIVIIALIVMFGLFAIAKASNDNEEEDDDEIFAELLFDLMIGVFMEACNQNDTCRAISNTIIIALILMATIIWCATGKCMCKSPSTRDIRRGATIYGGMRMHDYLRD